MMFRPKNQTGICLNLLLWGSILRRKVASRAICLQVSALLWNASRIPIVEAIRPAETPSHASFRTALSTYLYESRERVRQFGGAENSL